MAGFYIHIPYCKKACYYCDFHFIASLKDKDKMINALIQEIISRSEEWEKYTFDTIYFGGGTPSILSVDEIRSISNTIYEYYKINDNIEFTIEANPDDLTIKYLEELKRKTNVNRFSLGVQSFDDSILKFLNRRHNSKQAIDSILNAKKTGFNNITLDLIYGIPGLDKNKWKKNLDIFLELDIPHLSAYHLMIEPKTVFAVWQKKGKFNPVNEDDSLMHYKTLISFTKDNGYEHYEISNFVKNNMYSRHNTSYWKNIPYIGIGPSAHSFINGIRRWNISNNSKYIAALTNKQNDYYEYENLSINDKFNDYILTSLRTIWGAETFQISENYGQEYLKHCLNIIHKFKGQNKIVFDGENIRLTEQGWFISDYLMQEFFISD
jgi:oxygen-independent coproporphyrinogen-3 oxidase